MFAVKDVCSSIQLKSDFTSHFVTSVYTVVCLAFLAGAPNHETVTPKIMHSILNLIIYTESFNESE